MEDNICYTGMGKKGFVVAYSILTAVCCIVGLVLHSLGLFADGVLTLLFLSDLFKVEGKKSVPSTVISVVGLVLGIYALISGFFNLSATIGYADAAASIYVFPLFAIILLAKIAIVAFSEAGSQERANTVLGFIVTLLVIVGTVATFLEGHYFEPAVAASIGVYSVYKSVKSIFRPIESHNSEPEDEKDEG